MLVLTLRTSAAWQSAVPHVCGATRRSPGLTKREHGITRLPVCSVFHLLITCGIRGGARRQTRGGISAVAIHATQPHGAGGMHCGLVGADVTGDAAGALAISLGLRLSQKARLWRLRLGARTMLHRKQQNEDNKKRRNCELPEIQPARQSAPPGIWKIQELLRLGHSLVHPGPISKLKS